jgi:hypothetical protein
MAFSFPASPATNDTYTVGSRTYTWTGSFWEMTGGLITTSQLTDLGVTTAKIDNLSVTAGKIASDAVATAKILDANVTAAKLASGAAVSNIGFAPAPLSAPTFTGTVVLPSTTSIGTVSATEIGYVDGVTSAIQTQLDSKLTATTAVTSGRNAVINGAMNVWQRGTSSASQGYVTADRWYMSGASTTYSQETSDLPTNFRYALKCTMSGTATPSALHVIETQNAIRFANKTVVLSYYVKTSNSTNAVVRLDSSNNVDETVTGTYSVIASTSVATTTSWTRVSATFAVPSTCKTLRVVVGSSGNLTSGQTILISGVQLEEGAVATPFEFEDIGTTLAKCQRYYNKVASILYAPGRGITGSGRNGLTYDFPVRMRTAATVLSFADGAGTANRATYHSVNLGNGANHGLTINTSIASDSRFFIVTDSYSGFDFYIQNLELSAEL